MSDVTEISAAETGRRIEAGELDAREATEAYLANIAASPHADKIYARTTPDAARAEANAAATW